MTNLDQMLDLLPQRFKGPGGVAGVVRDGHVVARRAWGYADTVARLPMTPATRVNGHLILHTGGNVRELVGSAEK